MAGSERFLVLLQSPDFLEQQTAHGDDGGIARAKPLARAIHNGSHALLNGLILRGEAVDAGHGRGPLLAAIDQVIVVMIAHGAEGNRVRCSMHKGIFPDCLPFFF